MREKRPILEGRAERLDEIGFNWLMSKTEPWSEMFEKLKAYKRKYGDYNVPQKWKEDRKLGRWVNTQRLHYKMGDIKPERIKILNSIGFIWNARTHSQDPQLIIEL